MRALVKYEQGPQKVRLMDRPVPQPGEGQVRVRVHYAGICGTDIHIYRDDGGYATRPPVTLGHELSGVVDAVGPGVDPALVGRKVVSETYFITCGHCFYCQTGKPNLCPEKKSIGSGVDGAMAEFVVVPRRNLHLLPQQADLQQAALTEPLACCVQAVEEMAAIRPGDRVLITGPGAIGLMCLQLSVLAGGRVAVAGTARDRDRLELARTLGAEAVFFSDRPGGGEEIAGFFAPFGPDILLECSGAGAAVQMALSLLRKGGRYVQVGLTGAPTPVDMNLVTLKELTIHGTYAQKPVWWTRALELMEAGKLCLAPLISGVKPLEEWEEAFRQYAGGEGLKYLLTPMDPAASCPGDK